MNRILRAVVLALPIVLVLAPGACWAPFDAFLKLDGIEGESTDSKHQGEIDVLSFHWGENLPSPVSTGRVSLDALTVTKQLDKSSPKLAKACAVGRLIPTASLTLTRAGGDKQPYMVYQLTNAIVTAVQVGGSTAGESGVPTEEISLAFSKICWTYTVIGVDGKIAGQVPACYDAGTSR